MIHYSSSVMTCNSHICLPTESQSLKAMCPPSFVCLSTSQRWGMSLWVFSSTSLLSSPQRCFTTRKTRRLQPSCLAVVLTGRPVRPPAQTAAVCFDLETNLFYQDEGNTSRKILFFFFSSFSYEKFSSNRKLSYFPWRSENAAISDICLNCRGSKIVIEGENLDSVYRTIIRFKPNESHLKPVIRVRC